MDPNANLEESLKLAHDILSSEYIEENDANRLAELVEALDEWLTSGGFLPYRWDAKARREERSRNADHIDGYDRDDLGESPDF